MKENPIEVPVDSTKVQETPRYNIGEIIGSGKYATVYVGSLNNILIAVKRNKYPYREKPTNRFTQEANILKKLSHPNIIKFIKSENHAIYNELLDDNLEEVVKSDDHCVNKAECIVEIAKGLQYIHSFPILHRDIKPENIFVKFNEKNISYKIGDFGFAVACEKVHTDTDRIGSPAYMAYEIIAPSPKDHPPITYFPATDMWAFGILCWFLYTKQEVYSALKSVEEYRDFIIAGKRLTFDGFDEPTDQSGIFDLIKQCWVVEPEKRPSASDFIEFFSNGVSKKIKLE